MRIPTDGVNLGALYVVAKAKKICREEANDPRYSTEDRSGMYPKQWINSNSGSISTTEFVKWVITLEEFDPTYCLDELID